MREEVRAWILARPALVRQLCGADAGPLLVAAPYLRIDGDRWQLPGGPAAAPIWLAVAGVTSDAPEPLLLALLRGDGLPAYMLEVVATLSDDQQRAVLSLASADVGRRVAAGLELLDGLRIVARGWDLRERPFWRPSADPAFLLGQLRVGANDRLLLPGGRLFWTLVFGDGGVVPRDAAARVGVGRSDAGLGGMARVADLDRARRPISRCATSRCCSRHGGSRRPTRRRRPRSRRSSAATRATRSSCASSIAWVSTTSRALPRWSTAPTAWRRPRPTGAATRRWCAGRARSSSSIT